MQRKLSTSRRSFIAAAAAGVAGARLYPRAYGADAHALDAKDQAPTLRLHRNESPYGLAPAAAEAVKNGAIERAHRYPIEEPAVLAEAIAKRVGVDKEQIAVACGSIEVLKMATEAFCSPTRAAIVAEPTFEAVVSYAGLIHAHAVKVPLNKDYRHDLPRMLRASHRGAGMIFFCNPSNPAGTFVDKREVERFVRRLPRGVVLLADEAYGDYVENSEYESCLRYVKEGLPVIVSHTFSKIYGMAGLRVGYAIGRKDLIKRMIDRRLANNPNQVAIAAAIAALKDDDEFVARVKKLNIEARDYLYSELRALGLTYIPSAANFVTIDLGRPAKPLIEELKKRKVLVGRLFPSIPKHMRVTLGTPEEMKVFVREFKGVVNATPA